MASLPRRLAFAFVLGMLLSGCGVLNGAAPEESRLPLEVLYKGSQCGGAKAGATWIDRPQDLPPVLRRSASAQWPVQSEGALWIRMGSQPTGGFGLELAEPTAGVRSKAATIRIEWRRPAPDRFVTQAFTSPCLLLKMPKADIERILVVDQDGQPRAEVDLP